MSYNYQVYLTNKANSHENIIQFRGVTKLEDEKKYSLVLEYADGGTLGKYLRNNAIEWENQLRFAKEITSAVLRLHKRVVHGILFWTFALKEMKKSHLEDHYAELLNTTIDQYDFHDFTNYKTIGSGGSASVYVANWKNTSTIYAIKKSVDNKEVYLTNKANSHENIIQFRGVTKFEDGNKYSLVLEYVDGGTLGEYLRDNIIEWKNQLRFAKEITSAVLWLHDYKGIVHGDLHPNNILIHKGTIKLADFGRSCLKGSNCYNTEVWGVISYVDPKMLDQTTPYTLNEKSDIYSLGVLFWGLTSRSSPFNGLDDNLITVKILNGVREEPVPNTNVIFIGLYQKCWDQEPDKRPNISQVNSVLNSIDSENNNVSAVSYPKGNEESKKTEIVHSCQIDLKIV
ncbi:hypothetical protein RclHR1_00720047 [Rhizophagus clarus]|uniref:Protein kinase domain-containing protein n=1 Tax=Rhizophagus clarus TaxID=94130 RepID=A0A2Z6RV86_9GLOM|nr:hypothetical protein RclHR1_00720047 [Rhizophagus clarus]